LLFVDIIVIQMILLVDDCACRCLTKVDWLFVGNYKHLTEDMLRSNG
jgi:hypothetical protein